MMMLLLSVLIPSSLHLNFNRYAHDLEKRQQAVRTESIKKLSRNETHSSVPKIPFTPQDDGVSFPGGIMSTPSSSQHPSELDAPPAYTVSEATEMVGGSHGGHLSYGAVHEHQQQELKKRRVPPPPSKGEK